MSPIRLILHPLRAVPLFAALLLGGCDREKGADRQAATHQAKLAAPKAAPAAPKESHRIDRSRRGTLASGASFIGPDDREVSLAEFRGKPVLLNLWATWCGPCIKEMPSLDRLAAARAEGLTVLTVAQDIQGAAAVDPWFQRAGLTQLQPYLDPGNNLLADYNSPLPVTVLIGADGRELWRVTGAMDWQGAVAAKLLSEATAPQ